MRNRDQVAAAIQAELDGLPSYPDENLGPGEFECALRAYDENLNIGLEALRDVCQLFVNPAEPERDKRARATAIAEHYEEGTLEIDDTARVSRAPENEDQGAYVQAWIWIPDPEAEEGTL